MKTEEITDKEFLSKLSSDTKFPIEEEKFYFNDYPNNFEHNQNLIEKQIEQDDAKDNYNSKEDLELKEKMFSESYPHNFNPKNNKSKTSNPFQSIQSNNSNNIFDDNFYKKVRSREDIIIGDQDEKIITFNRRKEFQPKEEKKQNKKKKKINIIEEAKKFDNIQQKKMEKYIFKMMRTKYPVKNLSHKISSNKEEDKIKKSNSISVVKSREIPEDSYIKKKEEYLKKNRLSRLSFTPNLTISEYKIKYLDKFFKTDNSTKNALTTNKDNIKDDKYNHSQHDNLYNSENKENISSNFNNNNNRHKGSKLINYINISNPKFTNKYKTNYYWDDSEFDDILNSINDRLSGIKHKSNLLFESQTIKPVSSYKDKSKGLYNIKTTYNKPISRKKYYANKYFKELSNRFKINRQQKFSFF